jgi:hypothetical protein
VWDITDVRRPRESSINVAVMFSCLLAGIWLLVTAVDAFLNRKAAAVCLPNLTCHMPENADQARFIFWQWHVVAELHQVSSCRHLVWCSQLIEGQMALQNEMMQQQLKAMRMQLDFAHSHLNLFKIAWLPFPGSGEDMEQNLSSASGSGNDDKEEGV